MLSLHYYSINGAFNVYGSLGVKHPLHIWKPPPLQMDVLAQLTKLYCSYYSSVLMHLATALHLASQHGWSWYLMI